MNKAQRNEMKLKIAEDTSYALFRVTTGSLNAAMTGIDAAKEHLQQLIDDERDRAERREHENDTMVDDEKSEE
jgi:hypothetical protein